MDNTDSEAAKVKENQKKKNNRKSNVSSQR